MGRPCLIGWRFRNAWLAALVVLAGCVLCTGAASAQAALEVSPNVRSFVEMLGNRDVQEWLLSQQTAVPAAAPPADVGESFGRTFSNRLSAIRGNLAALARAFPRVIDEFSRASHRLRDANAGYGLPSLLLYAAGLVGIGLFAQFLVRRLFRAERPSVTEPKEASRLRPRTLGRAMVREFAGLMAFSVGCVGPFLLFERASLPQSIVMTFLLAALVLVATRSVATALLAPRLAEGTATLRPVPLSDTAAAFLYRRLLWAVGWLALGWAFVETTHVAGMEVDVSRLIAYALGLGLLAIVIDTVWRLPPARPVADTPDAAAPLSRLWAWLLSVYFVLLWAAGVAGATALFWLMAIALVLPALLIATRKSTRHLFDSATAMGSEDQPSAHGVIVDAALRALLVAGGLWVLANAWGVRFAAVAGNDDPLSRLTRALLTVVVILLVLDIVWQFTRTAIDLSLRRAAEAAPNSPEAVRRAKLRTLLPIARNVSMVFLATLAVLMSLSSLGVQIAPLIASAGVVGVAIGFGAQTLVKDVISGMFYLLDDAFRVGEYIVSGKFRGTVESFSLRSVRLRHHRGPVFTIPFGELGAVQNLSRDYVIDKLVLTVTYDTDIEKARKLLKKIGQQLMEDPELAPTIIDPLKMQAIGDFGDYGIQLKLKMTTIPGAQYAARKKAYPLIKKAFDENGIEFAYPTVKVAENAPQAKAAAIQQVVGAKAKPAAE